MRGKLLYRIEIAEKGAPGLSDSEAGMVRPYSEVFSIKWGTPTMRSMRLSREVA